MKEVSSSCYLVFFCQSASQNSDAVLAIKRKGLSHHKINHVGMPSLILSRGHQKNRNSLVVKPIVRNESQSNHAWRSGCKTKMSRAVSL